MSSDSTIPHAIAAIKAGRPLIVIDDPGRENQGDLFFPAATADVAKVNLMMQACRGLICVPLTRDYARQLELPLMVEPSLSTEATGVGFTVSVDARDVTAFGISAEDRTKTIRTLADKMARPADLVRPGHVFPLLARPGGILERQGHTEAATELAELAGLPPVGVICEILTDKGKPAGLNELKRFAEKYNVGIVAIADLVAYRKTHTKETGSNAIVQQTATSSLPTAYGRFRIDIYKSIIDGREHTALSLGELSEDEPVLTRVHSQCLTGDTFGSLRCDCNAQLHKSLDMIRERGRGVVVYLAQEGRGIGLGNKIKAYALQDKGLDTVEANHQLGLPADARDYQAAADMLSYLGIREIDLLTNNPAKEQQIAELGISIRQTVPLEIPPNDFNMKYLVAKKRRLNHRLNGV